MSTHGSDPFAVNLSDSNDTINIEEMAKPHVLSGKISKKNIVKAHKCEQCERAFVSRSLLSSRKSSICRYTQGVSNSFTSSTFRHFSLMKNDETPRRKSVHKSTERKRFEIL